MNRQFSQMYERALRAASLRPRERRGGECQTGRGTVCPLCHAAHLTYEDEVRIKTESLQEFLREVLPATALEPLIPSPAGRGYRTVSKRKVFPGGKAPRLGLIDPDEKEREGRADVGICAIEPAAHAAVYDTVQELLGTASLVALAEVLRYVIVRGSTGPPVIILSVRAFSPAVTKAANSLSRTLSRRLPVMGGLYLYEDPSDGRYYLGTSGRGDSRQLRRVYGAKELKHRVAGKTFSYPPHGFSQVNHSVLDVLVDAVRGYLDPHPGDVLLDLYCGYGLFALCFAGHVRRVLGAEVSRDAVEAARRNADFQKVTNSDFVRSTISEETIGGLLRRAQRDCCVILDPPRGGAGEGVIERIAEVGARNVVHLVCAIDLLEREVRRWTAAGCRVARVVPVDVFPGTNEVELVLQVTARDRRGTA